MMPQAPHRPTFLQYINAQQRQREDEVCEFDFILDAKHDPKLRGVTSLEKLKSYLRDCNACPEAILAAGRVWKQYKQYLKTAKIPV